MRCLLSILTLLIILSAHSGCITPPMPPQCASFFSLPGDERDKVFPSYPLDQQLTIYRCGMNRRPPDTYLAGYIADRGEPVIPILLTKLEQESDELTQVSIIRIFELIALDGHLRSRADVLGRIRTVISRMRIKVFKDMASESLQKMTQFST
jgi:hypothetical protein